MKNIVPLVVAVLLGLAAVFAVNRTSKGETVNQERTREVCIITTEMKPGEAVAEARVATKRVPESAVPKNAIDAANRALTFNQKVKRGMVRGDYLLYSDLELEQGHSQSLGEGEWGIVVKFSDSGLLKLIEPGDDIAIAGTFSYQEYVKLEKNADAEAKAVNKTVTAVIYPRVTVLSREANGVLLAMQPQQAVALSAIQDKVEKLFPILRRKNDNKALNRKDGGVFVDSALVDIVKELPNIVISEKTN